MHVSSDVEMEFVLCFCFSSIFIFYMTRLCCLLFYEILFTNLRMAEEFAQWPVGGKFGDIINITVIHTTLTTLILDNFFIFTILCRQYTAILSKPILTLLL